MRPQSVSAPDIEREFLDRGLICIKIDDGWQEAILELISKEGPEPDNSPEIKRLKPASANTWKNRIAN